MWGAPTVVLATVLFLVALSPRFRSRRVRFALLLLTGGLAVCALATIVTFPRPEEAHSSRPADRDPVTFWVRSRITDPPWCRPARRDQR